MQIKNNNNFETWIHTILHSTLIHHVTTQGNSLPSPINTFMMTSLITYVFQVLSVKISINPISSKIPPTFVSNSTMKWNAITSSFKKLTIFSIRTNKLKETNTTTPHHSKLMPWDNKMKGWGRKLKEKDKWTMFLNKWLKIWLSWGDKTTGWDKTQLIWVKRTKDIDLVKLKSRWITSVNTNSFYLIDFHNFTDN